MTSTLVLVTGGSGFVGSHCILAALRSSYQVRTTLRSLNRADEVRQMLRTGGATDEAVQGVEFCVADLLTDAGWSEACQGCEYVLHVASPFPSGLPKDAEELIGPARDGTLRVLKAAKGAKTVKRVVVTSSFAAIGYGRPQGSKQLSEEDWTRLDDPEFPVPAYPKSKTIAERAAWDWIAKEGGAMELTVVNPVGIYGPILSKQYAFSIELVSRLMNGQMPGLPKLCFAVVDVRDVADLHMRAMVDPKAAGQRFLAASDDGFLWTRDIALKLKHQLGDKAKNVPTRQLPNLVFRMVGWFDGAVAVIVPELGKEKALTNQKAKSMLGWQPRSAEEALMASAVSLIEQGVVKLFA
ncbi:hypothetical protein LTR09_002356 [Extremus antarcticus]|uniref:NAD-dependent epimerase/dehydratase domain-containing protein n=1 Tax=Extremus antarcticus TaxID=702011 RepID=A0AAJ0GFP2_9PEZI|nr:hypothetical protein LTR09_002356 [Extremus antarcticus]